MTASVHVTPEQYTGQSSYDSTSPSVIGMAWSPVAGPSPGELEVQVNLAEITGSSPGLGKVNQPFAITANC